MNVVSLFNRAIGKLGSLKKKKKKALETLDTGHQSIAIKILN